MHYFGESDDAPSLGQARRAYKGSCKQSRSKNVNDIEVSNTLENRERHFKLVVYDTRENTSLSTAWVMIVMTERLLSFISSRRLRPLLFQRYRHRMKKRMGAEVGASCNTNFVFTIFLLEFLAYFFIFFPSFVYLLFICNMFLIRYYKSSHILSLSESAISLQFGGSHRSMCLELDEAARGLRVQTQTKAQAIRGSCCHQEKGLTFRTLSASYSQSCLSCVSTRLLLKKYTGSFPSSSFYISLVMVQLATTSWCSCSARANSIRNARNSSSLSSSSRQAQ